MPASGQSWTTLNTLRKAHSNKFRRLTTGLMTIESTPAFGIAQRAIIARTEAGNVLWECLALRHFDGGTVLHWADCCDGRAPARRPWRSGGSPGRGSSCRWSVSHSISTGKRLSRPNLCSTAATMRSRTSSPVTAGRCHEAHGLPGRSSRGRRPRARARRCSSRSPGRPSTSGCCARPRQCASSCRRSSPPAWRWSRSPSGLSRPRPGGDLGGRLQAVLFSLCDMTVWAHR